MLKDLDNIDLIIFTKLDRFSRNVRDANNLLVELDKHNTSFKAIDEDDIDTSTADGRFIFNLKVNLAEHERNKDSERINRVNNYKYKVSKTVCSGQKIFGYNINEKKQLVINDDEAEQIRALYKCYLDTFSLAETYKWFRENIGNKSRKSVRIYLTDPKYIGKYKTTRTKEILEDFCPAILDEETFYSVQKHLNKNIKDYSNQTKKREYIFSSIVFCKECGYKLSGGTRGAKTNYTKIYRCKQHFQEKKCLNAFAPTEQYIEKYLKENILILANNYILNATKQKKVITKNNINVIKNKMNKLVDLYLNDMIDKEKYHNDYEILQMELKIEEEKTSQKEQTSNVENIKKFLENDFLNIYDSLSDKEKQRLWKNIIDKIIISKDKDIEIKFI